jgi:hypothetical protein
VSRSKRQKVRLFFMSGHSNTKSLPAPSQTLCGEPLPRCRSRGQ